MIEALMPYQLYRKCGLLWMDRIPAHWGLFRLGSVLMERKETNESREIHQVLSVLKDIGVIPYEQRGNVGNKKSEDIARYKIVRPNDIVMNSMNVIIGSVGLSRYTGCLSPVYYVLKRRSLVNEPKYLEAIFRVKLFQESLVCIGKGILAHRMRIPMELLKCELLPLPPPTEQAAIVRFLNHANRRIDRYIWAKKKLIALLNEQKQAIIHRAVTRGLNPNVPMKESGVPWLGQIPAHWDVRRAKYIFCEVDKRSMAGTEELLSVSHITGVTPRSQKNVTMFKAQSYAGHKLCRPGDLVINTMWAWMGALGVSKQTGIVSPAYAVYRPRRSIDLVDSFTDMLLRTRPYVSNFICRSTGVQASRLRLYPDQFFRIPIVLPPVSEQGAIAEVISTQTQGISKAIFREEFQIALIREYRARLVADVVTGQLDVREVARILPSDEIESEASFDRAEVYALEGEEDFEESEAG